jgi:cellobiose transport system permease protein
MDAAGRWLGRSTTVSATSDALVGSAVDDEPRGPRRKRRQAQHGPAHEEPWAPYLFISPFFVLFSIFGVFTLLYTLWVSLHDWSLLGGMNSFVGLENYARLLDDPRFLKATVNTFSLLLLSTVPQMAMALVLAEILNDRLLRGSHLFRSGLLVPNITSVVAIAIVFQSLFARQNGLINAVIQLVGFEPLNWHAGRLSSHIAIASMVNWQFTGFNTLIFLAALQAIPLSYYEAAQIDGANRIQRFFRISLPLLRPAILFAVVLSVIGQLQLFAQPLLFGAGAGSTSGGNDNQYLTVLLYLYGQAFQQPFRFGYSAAIAWTLVLMSAVAAALVFGINALLDHREDRAERQHRKALARRQEVAR